MLLVVVGVLRAVCLQSGVKECGKLRGIALGIPWHEQRADLRADEVIGAACAEVRELFGLAGVHELKDLRRVSIGADEPLLPRDGAAQVRHDLCSNLLTIVASSRLRAAETLVLAP